MNLVLQGPSDISNKVTSDVREGRVLGILSLGETWIRRMDIRTLVRWTESPGLYRESF